MRKVITYGTFDLLHYGHINLLKRAKEQGDYVIVALSTDEFNRGKGKECYFSYEDRKKLLEAIRYVYDKLDMVLQMTVNPGFGGQSYIPAMTEKIRELRKRLDEAGYQKVDIEVDGGVNQKTLDAVLEAGASIIVAGSAVFKGDISANIARFREKIGTYAQGREG